MCNAAIPKNIAESTVITFMKKDIMSPTLLLERFLQQL